MTDAMLSDLEDRIAREYADALRDMEAKLKDLLDKYEHDDAIQKKLLSQGKITQEEYKSWAFRHKMMNKRWEQMRDVLAEDMHHANEIALRIAQDQMPDVYALNANYALYEIETGGRINTGLTLYNHDTAAYLLSEQRQLMPGPSTKKQKEIAGNKDLQWNQKKIQSAVFQGVIQGETPFQVAQRLMSVAKMNYNAAVRYARTMTTNAQNSGRYNSYHRARDLGVELTIEWRAVLDMHTRHDHRMMHGQRREVDEPFNTPDGFSILYPAQSSGPGSSDIPQKEIWNCFIGETEVASDSEIVRSYKHLYHGELIRVKTAGGLDFTCTPNHPILTPNGWVAAGFLHKGDNLLVTSVRNNGVLLRDANINKAHTSFKTLHDAFVSLWDCQRVSMSDFNFHGDIPTADVEVVSKKRVLNNNRNASEFQKKRKIGLKKADSLILCKGHFMPCLRRIYISALSIVGGFCEKLSFFWRCLSHSNIHRLGTVARGNTSVTKYSINDLPTATVIRSELLRGLTGKVFLDNIIAVDNRSGCAHVYNLQTENGYYFVGSSIAQNGETDNGNYAIAKNCRCTLRAWVKGFEGETVTSSPGMEGLSFEEWQDEAIG